MNEVKTSFNPGIVVIGGRTIFHGKMIMIYIAYCHVSPAMVRACPVGRIVSPGEILGKYATQKEIETGALLNKTNPGMGPHLHFEIRQTLEFLMNDTLKIGIPTRTAYPWGP
jgi:murein DD-endopeptidase MepM/ murein hydrolase activator NlpD